MSLDLSRLENLRRLPGKMTAQCPACAEEGRDRKGLHLVIFDEGPYSCVATDDRSHSRRIWELVGIRDGPVDPEEQRRRLQEWSVRQRLERRLERERCRKADAARAALRSLLNRWRWDPADLWESSPTHPEEAADDPRLFLCSLFESDDVIWTGGFYDTGKEIHRDRWRSASDWCSSPRGQVGPMVTPCTWKPEIFGRIGGNVAAYRFVVLDFDGPRGWKPKDGPDLRRHIENSLAITRWIWEDRGWNLAAIIETGGKSIHAWFDHPGDKLVAELKECTGALGIDSSLIGEPQHPARLPGQRYEESARFSRTLWLR